MRPESTDRHGLTLQVMDNHKAREYRHGLTLQVMDKHEARECRQTWPYPAGNG